jgi:hypothetical protein
MAQFPKPYVNEVPKEGDSKIMEYVDFKRMGIGARPSGVPKDGVNAGGMNIEHVGGSASGKK